MNRGEKSPYGNAVALVTKRARRDTRVFLGSIESSGKLGWVNEKEKSILTSVAGEIVFLFHSKDGPGYQMEVLLSVLFHNPQKSLYQSDRGWLMSSYWHTRPETYWSDLNLMAKQHLKKISKGEV